jgi:hypothetical protein
MALLADQLVMQPSQRFHLGLQAPPTADFRAIKILNWTV